MVTNQPSYVNDVSGEVVVDNTPGEPVIPTQRRTPPNRPTALGRGEQKPILPRWVKKRAEFISKVSELGK